MVNFGPLAAEIDLVVWGTPANFNGFRILAALLRGTPVLDISRTLWRWTEGATYIRQGGHHVGPHSRWFSFNQPRWNILKITSDHWKGKYTARYRKYILSCIILQMVPLIVHTALQVLQVLWKNSNKRWNNTEDCSRSSEMQLLVLVTCSNNPSCTTAK